MSDGPPMFFIHRSSFIVSPVVCAFEVRYNHALRWDYGFGESVADKTRTVCRLQSGVLCSGVRARPVGATDGEPDQVDQEADQEAADQTRTAARNHYAYHPHRAAREHGAD